MARVLGYSEHEQHVSPHDSINFIEALEQHISDNTGVCDNRCFPSQPERLS